MNERSYLFIGDLIETDEQLPLNLFDDFFLQRATTEQQRVIKHFIDSYIDILTFKINKYESTYAKNDKSSYDIVPMEDTDWKYYVIEHTQRQAKQQLQLILSLSSLDLTVLFEAVFMGVNTTAGTSVPGVMQFQLRTLNYFHDTQFNSFPLPETKKITKQSLEELSKINLLLSHFDKIKFPLIDKALTDFVSIKDISERSPFKVLSCFSVLELLLTTYRPRTSSDSSLSNQLQKKINLLNNQFEDKIDFQAYFNGSDTNTLETVIEKLYQYRNDIAHGNLSNFEKDLQIFKSQQKNILPFLLDLLKRILITSLQRPQLISDLKEC